MWCANCKSDVVAEVSGDNRRVKCSTCDAELSVVEGSKTDAAGLSQKAKEARELLERWSSTQLLDPFGPTLSKPSGTIKSAASPKSDLAEPLSSKSPAGEASSLGISDATVQSSAVTHETQSTSSLNQPAQRELQATRPEPQLTRRRIDRPHRQSDDDQPALERVAPTIPQLRQAQRQQLPVQAAVRDPQSLGVPRLDQPHASIPPHIDVLANSLNQEQRKTNWVALAGQFLAYGGVLALTVGASMVLWSYFGGPVSYAPTGWLITTAGQMLLFLGIVTLVSGGMEQTTDEVARRIDTLGDRIIRIEQMSREQLLRGPNISADSFATNDSAANEPANSANTSDERVSGDERVVVKD